MRLLAAAFFFFLLAPIAFAQVSPGSAAISITFSPLYPAPGQQVTLTAQSSSIDLSASAITWSANGTTIAQGAAEVSTTITAGAAGSSVDIAVNAIAADGSSAAGEAVLRPTAVDLLVDSDSYVPAFYRGAALPSAGTNLILLAMPHFVSANGSAIPSSQLIYTWKRNGEVIAEASGYGKFSAIIPAPPLFGTDTIEVDVKSSDGALAGVASIAVPSATPQLILYEDHPLYGIRYDNALSDTTIIPEQEMEFAAAPYFAQAVGPNDPLLSYGWSVNSTQVNPDPKNPSELTINGDQSTGQALVSLEVTHQSNFFLDLKGQWQITLSSGTPSNDVFGNPTN